MYKVKQSTKNNLEKDLNEEYEKGYVFKCIICKWKTSVKCNNGRYEDYLITYLLSSRK